MKAPTPITPEIINEIAGLINRRNELGKIAVATPETLGEQRANEAKLTELLLHHGAELVNAWVIVKHEYEPFLAVMDSTFSRVMQARAAMAQQQQPNAAAPQG